MNGLVESVTVAEVPEAWFETMYGPGQLENSVQSNRKPK